MNLAQPHPLTRIVNHTKVRKFEADGASHEQILTAAALIAGQKFELKAASGGGAASSGGAIVKASFDDILSQVRSRRDGQAGGFTSDPTADANSIGGKGQGGVQQRVVTSQIAQWDQANDRFRNNPRSLPAFA